ncbi:hypothetical protein I547_4161 [Mycobacterium kansasii 824]|uniref:Uncharacterized protein n=1 Tax=Mycobacterium kansasii TaxID=1768 RepID=A0A1V3XJ66_MYCKA|nr:hypothetical protein I547_4161 [Mycobacterium kansasii 824]OOK79130.1 hypothetical protein BZL30_1886 [Mycobacterium kansasii]
MTEPVWMAAPPEVQSRSLNARPGSRRVAGGRGFVWRVPR